MQQAPLNLVYESNQLQVDNFDISIYYLDQLKSFIRKQFQNQYNIVELEIDEENYIYQYKDRNNQFQNLEKEEDLNLLKQQLQFKQLKQIEIRIVSEDVQSEKSQKQIDQTTILLQNCNKDIYNKNNGFSEIDQLISQHYDIKSNNQNDHTIINLTSNQFQSGFLQQIEFYHSNKNSSFLDYNKILNEMEQPQIQNQKNIKEQQNCYSEIDNLIEQTLIANEGTNYQTSSKEKFNFQQDQINQDKSSSKTSNQINLSNQPQIDDMIIELSNQKEIEKQQGHKQQSKEKKNIQNFDNLNPYSILNNFNKILDDEKEVIQYLKKKEIECKKCIGSGQKQNQFFPIQNQCESCLGSGKASIKEESIIQLNKILNKKLNDQYSAILSINQNLPILKERVKNEVLYNNKESINNNSFFSDYYKDEVKQQRCRFRCYICKIYPIQNVLFACINENCKQIILCQLCDLKYKHVNNYDNQQHMMIKVCLNKNFNQNQDQLIQQDQDNNFENMQGWNSIQSCNFGQNQSSLSKSSQFYKKEEKQLLNQSLATYLTNKQERNKNPRKDFYSQSLIMKPITEFKSLSQLESSDSSQLKARSHLVKKIHTFKKSEENHIIKIEMENSGKFDWTGDIYIKCVQGFAEGYMTQVKNLMAQTREHFEINLQIPQNQAKGQYVLAWRLIQYKGNINKNINSSSREIGSSLQLSQQKQNLEGQYFGPRVAVEVKIV